MSDEEKNETTEEPTDTAPPVEQTPAEPVAAEPEAAPEAAEPEAAAEAETAEPEAEAPADEPAAEVTAPAEEPAAPPEPARKQKKLKHVPRGERRTRTRKKREPAATRKPIVRLEKPEHDRGRRQERRGVVVSDAMDKTIVVKVETVKAHPRYQKVLRRSTKFHAHDEQNRAHVGDLVRIVETKPLSKTKNWRLAEVLEVAK
jgi:small subunit ribosomal protein S17